MENILFFLIWAAAIFLVMRIGCGSHVVGHNHSGSHDNRQNEGPYNLRWVPPETDIDPVCERTIRTETAKSSVHEGHVYYFCSRECRERFEAAPQTYLLQPKAGTSEAAGAIEAEEHAHG